jgi:hypothetical protein
MADTETLDVVEQLYQIKLTERQRLLLTTSKALLAPLEQQAAYLMRMALTPCKCPACKAVICLASAADDGYNPESSVVTSDDSYGCPFCQARLHWFLTLSGHQGFELQDGQTITTGKQA